MKVGTLIVAIGVIGIGVFIGNELSRHMEGLRKKLREKSAEAGVGEAV